MKTAASPQKISALTHRLLPWFAAQARDLPWRHTTDPYAIWVSEIMLQQTQVKTVIPYWNRWLRELPNLQGLATAPPEKIHKLWEGLGYYTRVRNMQKAAQSIVAEHGGIFPRRHEDILELCGVGRYTAGAISSIAFNQPAPLLDGNVIRVLTRVFGIAEDPKEKQTNARLWSLAEALVQAAVTAPFPDPRCSHLNQSLMELGALICSPRQPQCLLCPLRAECVAYAENLVEKLPNLGERTAATARHFVAFVAERKGRYLVRQRPAGVVNAHLWEFPNVELTTPGPGLAEAAAPFVLAAGAKPFCRVKHSITRYRITLEAYPAALKATEKVPGEWRTLAQLSELAFTSAHRKILTALEKE